MKKAFFLFFLISAFSFGSLAQTPDHAASVMKFREKREKEFKTPETSPFATYKQLKAFKGLKWYEIDAGYKVSAKLTRLQNEQQFRMPSFNGKETTKHRKFGIATFELNGQQHSLTLYQNEDSDKFKFLYLPFRDETNRDETYQGGRYIEVKNSGSDTITLDFNLAYNPDCAYSDIMICPIPPMENTLNTRIEAGERLFERKKQKEISGEKPKRVKGEGAKISSKPIAEPKEEDIPPPPKPAPRPTPKPPPSFEEFKKEQAKKEEARLASAYPNGKFADFDGNKVFYQDFGKGKEAIVFVHGWTCNSDFWKGQLSAFPDQRVIAIDLIGHGNSDKPKTSYTMDYFARSIDAVLKKAGIKKAVLAGHSMGTPVVRQYYRLSPEKVAGLVIVDGGLRPFAPRAQMEQFTAPLRANYAAVAPTFVDGLAGSITPELKAYIKAEMLKTPDYVALSALDGMMDESIFANDKIEVPVLAILADSSFGQQKDIKEFLGSLIPDLDMRMWQGASHFLMMEKPQEFNQAVRFYLNKNKLLQ